MRKISEKRKKQNAEYLKIRKKYLELNSACELCGIDATEIHHKKKRNNERLLDVNYFMSVCRSCHNLIHNNQEWSYERGYLIRG